jgi:hypothetical protein
MSKRPTKPAKSTELLPTDYAPLLAEIKARVQATRIKAGLAANRELLALYWDIGRLILDRQKREGWGAKVIDRLAVDLQREFPGQQGFSPRNLKYMRAFAGGVAGVGCCETSWCTIGGDPEIRASNCASTACTIAVVSPCRPA